ncbi:MAG: carbon-nitrogen hydrolase family protein [Armatimonadetes bacterium]|nr:carbon-nitrogen hydrolase family protein [Armatimonadota bacterium]
MAKIACYQSDVAFDQPMQNAAKACAALVSLSKVGVDMVIFPEAFLTGYCVNTVEDARRIAIDSNDSSLAKIQEAVNSAKVSAIVGFAERDGNLLYNTAALLCPEVPIRYYRKTHLPELGFDQFATPGNELPVFDTPIGKVGILICFDLRIPEAARTLALRGAELIAIPTNWPTGAIISAEHISLTRAAENRVFVATCNRIGVENGVEFFGRSRIYDLDGNVLAEEDLPLAAIDLSRARDKRKVTPPHNYITDTFATRQPQIYENE